MYTIGRISVFMMKDRAEDTTVPGRVPRIPDIKEVKDPYYQERLIGIMTLVSSCIHGFLWDVIIHPFHDFNVV